MENRGSTFLKLVELAGALSNRTAVRRWQRLDQTRTRALAHPTARIRGDRPTALSNRPGTFGPSCGRSSNATAFRCTRSTSGASPSRKPIVLSHAQQSERRCETQSDEANRTSPNLLTDATRSCPVGPFTRPCELVATHPRVLGGVAAATAPNPGGVSEDRT